MTILKTLVPDHLRIQHTHDLFGTNFSLRLEATIYTFANYLSKDYNGGYRWVGYTLSNGGFYEAPDIDRSFRASCANMGIKGLYQQMLWGSIAASTHIVTYLLELIFL